MPNPRLPDSFLMPPLNLLGWMAQHNQVLIVGNGLTSEEIMVLMTRPQDFERSELQALTSRAEMLEGFVASPRWKQAYRDFAQAASVLDAFMARCEETIAGGVASQTAS